jgi:hypothetical protein
MRQDAGYEADFYEWTQTQAAKLREAGSRRLNLDVDWENVAEEIESLGRSDLRGVESHVIRILAHLLKLEYSPASSPRADWAISVLNHRADAKRILQDSPSLRRKLKAALPDCYADARRLAAKGLERDGIPQADIPAEAPYSVEQVMDPDWFPRNRHGLE